jgi:hypothetical protein
VKRNALWGGNRALVPEERFRLVLDVEQEEHVLFDHLGSFEAALAVRARLMTAVNTHRE